MMPAIHYTGDSVSRVFSGLDNPPMSALLADCILALHFAIVAFNIGMVPLAGIGLWRRWPWITRPWLRRTHLAMMGLIAFQGFADQACPLTVLEHYLRENAGQRGYEGSMIGHWLGSVMYWDLPPWIFIAGYAGWFMLALMAWWFVKRRFSQWQAGMGCSRMGA